MCETMLASPVAGRLGSRSSLKIANSKGIGVVELTWKMRLPPFMV